MPEKTRKMNLPYAAMQGLYWLSYCSVVSFAVVVLQDRGYTNSVIGILLASVNILSYFLSGYLSDLIDRLDRVTVFTMLPVPLIMQALGLVLLLFAPGKSPLALIAFGLAMTAVQIRNPLIIQTSVFLQYYGGELNFSICRAGGSLSYMLGSTVLGWLLTRMSSAVLTWAGLLFALLQCLLDMHIRRLCPSGASKPSQLEGRASSAGEFIRENPRFTLMVLGAALIFFGHNVVNNYLINVTRYLGGDEATMGFIGGLAATYEIPVMILLLPVLKKWKLSLSTAMKVSFVAFAAKNILIAFASSVTGFCAALSLQGLSYAVFIAAGVPYVKQTIPGKDAAKAQAFLANVTLIGAAMSGLLGGRLYDSFGVRTVLAVSAAVVTLGAFISLTGVQKSEPAAENI